MVSLVLLLLLLTRVNFILYQELTCEHRAGTMFVRNDAKCFRFCRSKCSKNFKCVPPSRAVRATPFAC